MDGGRPRTTPPTRELGDRAARIGAAQIFFLGNGGPMQDLNSAFFCPLNRKSAVIMPMGSDGDLLEMLLHMRCTK
jgi:hypothetical protein